MFEMKDGSLPTGYGEQILITDIPLEDTPLVPVQTNVETDVEPAITVQSEPEEVNQKELQLNENQPTTTDGIVNEVEEFTNEEATRLSNKMIGFILIVAIVLIVIIIIFTCKGPNEININVAGKDVNETLGAATEELGAATKYLNNGVINLF